MSVARRRSRLEPVVGVATVLILLLPFLAPAVFGNGIRLELSDEVLETLWFTIVQAAASAALSVVFGVAGAYGLGAVRKPALLEKFALIPNAAPVILILLSSLKLFPWARGLTGIVLIHTFLNSGLVAVSVARSFRVKVAGQAALAWLEGASRWFFFRRGVLPALREDLILLLLFVFALCFSSFAVPLVIGGSRATTIEVLIFQKIRIAGDWPAALGLAVFESVILLLLTLILRREPSAGFVGRLSRSPLLSWRPGVLPAILPAVVLTVGMCAGLIPGFKQIMSMSALHEDLPWLFGGSLIVGVGTGALTAALLLLFGFIAPSGALRRFLVAYVAPSSVLTGFALLILLRDTGPWLSLVRIMFGIALVTVPSFYRLQWDTTLRALEGQRSMAWLLGASEGLTFMRVVFPQVVKPACFLGGLAALWAWGDFALSGVVAGRTLTLAMMSRSLMESYRLDAATAIVWLIVAGGIGTLILFIGVGNVLGSKSES
jgi:thiamine transport system permease protein